MSGKFVLRLGAALMLLVLAAPLRAQSSVTFQYFYDDLGQLIKVIDSAGNEIDYTYDAVGNIAAITRKAAPAAGTLAIFNFTPQTGPVGTTVTIQGQGFGATPSLNNVKFNGALATVTSATTSTLVATVPATATTGPISVTVGAQTATSGANFTFLPLPSILLVNPKLFVSSTTPIIVPTFLVTGANLTGSTFSFAPALTPPAVAVTSSTIDPSGASATLSLTISPGTVGSFTLIATSIAGSSSALAGPNNTLNILDPNGDADGDGLTNAVEIAIGTDPLNPTTSGVGLPDGWQVFYGLNPLNPANATATAADGLTILRNFQTSHDPRNPNLIPPSVSRFFPPDGATNVPINDSIAVGFNEPLLTGIPLAAAQSAISAALGPGSSIPPAGQLVAAETLQAYLNRTCCGNSVLPGTVTVNGPTAAALGSVTPSSDGLFLTFTPTGALLSNTTFKVQVQGLRDTAGNRMTGTFQSTFTTGASLDKVAPQIVGTSPANGSSAPTNTSVVVTFSKSIDPSSLTSASYFLTDTTTGLPISGAIETDPISFTATIVPSAPLALVHSFSVTLTSAIKDLAGNSLGATFGFGFTTGAVQVESVAFSLLNNVVPTVGGAQEAESDSFSLLNNISPAKIGPQEAESDTFSLLNNISPVKGTHEAESDTFSLLNNINPAKVGPQEAESDTFSLLNNISPVKGAQEAESDTFSLLNNISPAPGGLLSIEVDGSLFSLLNNLSHSPTEQADASGRVLGQGVPAGGTRSGITISGMVDSDGDGYPDDLEIALGSDPHDPNSIPKINPPPEADGIVFSVFNKTPQQEQIGLLNHRTKGENHVLKSTRLRKPNIFKILLGLPGRAAGFRAWR